MAAALAEICDAISADSVSRWPVCDSASADIIIELSGLRRSWPRMARNIWRERPTRWV
jgi:hypothetical protein